MLLRLTAGLDEQPLPSAADAARFNPGIHSGDGVAEPPGGYQQGWPLKGWAVTLGQTCKCVQLGLQVLRTLQSWQDCLGTALCCVWMEYACRIRKAPCSHPGASQP